MRCTSPGAGLSIKGDMAFVFLFHPDITLYINESYLWCNIPDSEARPTGRNHPIYSPRAAPLANYARDLLLVVWYNRTVLSRHLVPITSGDDVVNRWSRNIRGNIG